MKTMSLAFAFTTLLSTMSVAANDSKEAIQQAVDHPSRTAAYVKRDKYRKPVETLSFFEVKPDSTVVEISPGGGWYTEILAPLLAAHGTYYAAHFPANSTSEYYQRGRAMFIDKIGANPVYNRVKMTEFTPSADAEVAPAGSADVVLTFRNLHNWYNQKGDESVLAAYKSFYKALKPGGILGVVEHRLPENQLNNDWKHTGYFPQQLAIELAQQAGFEFVASSEINANSKDTADHPKGVWTLPPSLSLKEQDEAKYLAIGESDRMTLKFRKPTTKQ